MSEELMGERPEDNCDRGWLGSRRECGTLGSRNESVHPRCWVLILSRELSLCGRLSWLFRRLCAKPRIGFESPRRARLNRSCSAVEMRDSSSRLCSGPAFKLSSDTCVSDEGQETIGAVVPGTTGRVIAARLPHSL